MDHVQLPSDLNDALTEEIVFPEHIESLDEGKQIINVKKR